MSLSLAALVRRWNETVGKKYGEIAQNQMKSKFRLVKKNDKLTVIFSPSVRHLYTICVVECEERIMLKQGDETPLSLTALVKRWNETDGKRFGEIAEEMNLLTK